MMKNIIDEKNFIGNRDATSLPVYRKRKPMKKSYILYLFALPFAILLLLQWRQLETFHQSVITPRGFVPRTGDPIDLRGHRVAILRQLNVPPYEAIEVADDHRAVRFFYPQGPETPYNEIVLSNEVYQQFAMLQTTWCQVSPPSIPYSSGEKVYELGIRCSLFHTLQVAIPETQLPPFFVDLQQHLPPPPQ